MVAFAIVLYLIIPGLFLSMAHRGSITLTIIGYLCAGLYFLIITGINVEHRYDSEENFKLIETSYPLERKSIRPGESSYVEYTRLVYDKRGGIFWDAEPSSSNRYISRFSLWPERFNYNDGVKECRAKGGRLPSYKEAMRLYNASNNPGYDFHKFKIQLWPFGRIWWYVTPMPAYLGARILFKNGRLDIEYNITRVFSKKQSKYTVQWFKSSEDYEELNAVICVYPKSRFPDFKDKIKLKK